MQRGPPEPPVMQHGPLGFDVSGKVIAVGKDCKHIKVGDTVHGMSWVWKTGSLAEYMAIDESAINVVPEGMTEHEAAALPLVGHTSFSSLVTIGGLQTHGKQRVLILGGSSATGMMAIQLAKAYGAAHIASTCSPRNYDLVKSLGADETIDYREENVFDVMRGRGETFDIIYDTVGDGRWIAYWRLVDISVLPFVPSLRPSSLFLTVTSSLPQGAGASVWEGAADGVLAARGQLVTITGDVQRTLDLTDLLTRGNEFDSLLASVSLGICTHIYATLH